MTHTILVSTGAAKDLSGLPIAIQRRLRTLIDDLANDPRPRGARAMASLDDTFWIRVGDDRVVYTVGDAERLVVIARVGHRRDVYRRL